MPFATLPRAHACRRLAAARAEAAMTCSTDIQFNAETIKALADKPQAACVLQASSPKINELKLPNGVSVANQSSLAPSTFKVRFRSSIEFDRQNRDTPHAFAAAATAANLRLLPKLQHAVA